MEYTSNDSTSFFVPPYQQTKGPILVVEDDPAYARVLRRRLEMNDFEVMEASDGLEALELAQKKVPDLILSDWMMPRMDGVTMVEEIRKSPQLQAIYVILISNKSDTDEKVKGLERGADDYLLKTCATEELVARIQAGLRIRALQRALLRQANIDGLTNLFNRTYFFKRLSDEINRADRYKHPLTLTMIDLNDFKQINDTKGHLAGDAAIRYAADVIEDNCRDTDIVCRYGGDEFAVLFVNAEVDHSRSVMERISEYLADLPFHYDRERVPFGLSYGFATFVDGDEIPALDKFIAKADENLYLMKRERKKARAAQSNPVQV